MFCCNSFAYAHVSGICIGSVVFSGGKAMTKRSRVAGRPHPQPGELAKASLRDCSYGLQPRAAGILRSCWFPGWQTWGGKREHGSPSSADSANRGCPRNCERIAASITATGKLGRPDAKREPASQETCQHRHPTDGRGAPYGADFRSGDFETDAGAAAMFSLECRLNETCR